MPGVGPVKAEELQTLDADGLTSRLKGARRELYELRFKLAVGQLDDHRQIRKVRKDIARILTVVHARRLAMVPGDELLETERFETEAQPASLPREVGGVPGDAGGGGEPEAAPEGLQPVQDAHADSPGEETPEDVEAAGEAEPLPPARKPRRRAAAGDEDDDD